MATRIHKAYLQFSKLYREAATQAQYKALEAVIEKQPKGVATFVTIRDELKRFAA